MEKRKYGHQRMVMDFSLDEIAKGIEEVLSDQVSVERQLADGMIILSGQFQAGARSRFMNETRVYLDETYGELIRTVCNCDSFRKTNYACKHVCTLLGSFLLEEEDKEELKNTLLYEQLQKNTKVENPFLPGILRRTDTALKSFLATAKQPTVKIDKPQWLALEQKSKVEQISIDVVLNADYQSVTVELKAGPKRHYVIRELNQLLDCYQTNKTYTFSSTAKCAAGRNQYAEKNRAVMDFLYKHYEISQRRALGYEIFGNTYNEYYRSMRVAGRDLDTFMELLQGYKVSLSVDNSALGNFYVDNSKTPEALSLTKTDFGAMLEGKEQVLLACGFEWMYLCQDGTIMRAPAEQWEHRRSLSEALEGSPNLYIQDKDLPVLCEGLKVFASDETQLTVRGMELEQYIMEKPEIQIYLDYPQDDLITCEVKAKYTASGNIYNVCDQRKDKKKRNIPLEQAVGEAVWGHFSAFDESSKQMCLECDSSILYTFLTEVIPALSEIGEVFISDKMKKLKVRPVGEVSVGLQVDAGSLVMSLHSNLMTKDEMIEVLSAYSSKKKFTRLKNGEFIVMPDQDTAAWETMAETYRNYGKKNPEAMKLPLFRALYLQEGLQDREELQLETGDNYQALIRELSSEETWEYSVPDSLQEVLRGYQKDGFRWIKMLKKNGFGGILADDMGLGKTLQILSFLLSEKEEGKSYEELSTLIVAPASLIYNWKREIEEFTPGLSCRIVAGTAAQRREVIRQMQENQTEIFITSYDLLKRDIALYEGMHFANQIIDEAQYIKNQSTQVSKAVRLIDSSFRMALTGTPIENRLSELWSIFDYLMPGFLYSYSRFREEFETPVINDHDEVVMKRLRSLVHPFILRRLKKDVLQDLPDKLEETITVSLEGEQRKLYDAYAERLRAYLDKTSDEDFRQRKLEILAELTRLRQICCGPNLFLEQYKGENAKKEVCMELLHQAIDGGHKVLLFSQFTSVLDDIGASLRDEKIAYHRIDGSVRKEDRMEQVEAFARDEVAVFLISLKAGGTGLNLTAADIVIHYDPWWNIAAQNQATDRTHRIGQQNTVTVYQLIAEKTLEEQIAILQKAKAQLAQDVLEGEGIASIMIDKNDLLNLL